MHVIGDQRTASKEELLMVRDLLQKRKLSALDLQTLATIFGTSGQGTCIHRGSVIGFHCILHL